MTERFSLAHGTVTRAELRQAWDRMVGGRKYPRHHQSVVYKSLVALNPARFEFEINRARGFAFDNGETTYETSPPGR